MHKTIAIGADHRGFALKHFLLQHATIDAFAITWRDVGAYDTVRSDYPTYAHAVVDALQSKKAQEGILLCGTGIGMSIAANRFEGIFAGLAWNAEVAQRAREEDGCTILVLPADYLSEEQVIQMVIAWLSAEVRDGRYAERRRAIDDR